MLLRYYSFPTIDKLMEAEKKIGESEISFICYGINSAMVSANVTPSNEEQMALFDVVSKEVQGNGFVVIIAGNSDGDFAYKKKVLDTIISETDGLSMKTVERPEIEEILLRQCTRISGAIRETFRPGGYFKSLPVMGQRDLTVRWAIGAGEAKMPLIEKGLIVDDGGAFFGWGVEHGHLGKTEIFCAFSPMNPEAWKGVNAWEAEQGARAVDEKYFALTMASLDVIDNKTGPAMSNYHLWWYKVLDTLDPNGVIPLKGVSKLTP
jgi:hypothetical protein